MKKLLCDQCGLGKGTECLCEEREFKLSERKVGVNDTNFDVYLKEDVKQAVKLLKEFLSDNNKVEFNWDSDKQKALNKIDKIFGDDLK